MLLLFFTFLIFSTITLFGIIHSPLCNRFVDKPDKRKIHQILIPRVGGFGFVSSYIALNSIILALVHFKILPSEEIVSSNLFLPMLVGASIVFLIGFLDDSTFVDVNVPMKFAAQFLAAGLAVFLFNISIDGFTILGRTIELGVAGQILSLFWIVGVMNAYNIIDGIDGLSSSLTIISLSVAALIFYIFKDTATLMVIFPLIGVICGFLVYNYPPAKLFAGDTGSLFFGFAVALTSLKVGQLVTSDGQPIESLTTFFIAGVPVIEVVVSMIRRYWYGITSSGNIVKSLKKMVTPDNLHMHHRVIYKGFDHEQALHFLVFFGFAISLHSLIFALTDSSWIKLGTILYTLYLIFMMLKRLQYGKGLFAYASESSEDVAVRKTIAITGGNDYFENSIRYFTEKRYWIASIADISEVNNRYIEIFIIYNSSKEQFQEDVKQAKTIRTRFSQPIFFITDVADRDILKNLENTYVVKKPVDIPYLIHDMEKVTQKGFKEVSGNSLGGTLAIEPKTLERDK